MEGSGRRSWTALAGLALAVTLVTAAAAQDEPAAGDSGPAIGDFQETDGTCNFANFTDESYVATLGEDEGGRFVEFLQTSTGDAGVFRLDDPGQIVFETDGDEVYGDIIAVGGVLAAAYTYTSGDCSQNWVATVTLPPGFVDWLLADPSQAPEPEPEPEPPPPPPSTAPPTTQSPIATTEPSAVTTTTDASSTTVTTHVPEDLGGGDPAFLIVILTLLTIGIVFYVITFVLHWWVPPFLGQYVDRYGRKVTGALNGAGDDDGEERDTDQTTGPITERQSTVETLPPTTEEESETDEDGDPDQVSQGPEPLPDREPSKHDCEQLRVEAERLTAQVSQARLDYWDAEANVDRVMDEGVEASGRASDLSAKIRELQAREDAPQLYQRIAEAQRDLRTERDRATYEFGTRLEAARQAAREAYEAASEVDWAALEARRRVKECEAEAD